MKRPIRKKREPRRKKRRRTPRSVFLGRGCHVAWQEGYGAFSVSPSNCDAVIRHFRHDGCY